MTVYIYMLKHPVTGEVRYVGLTRFPAHRLNNEINYPHTKHLKNWVNSLKKEALKPIMEIVEEVDEDSSCSAERRWIAKKREQGCRLINFTDGGERGYKCSDEYRAALSAAIRGKKRRPMSDEHKQKISNSAKGLKRPWVVAPLIKRNKLRAGTSLTPEMKIKVSEGVKRSWDGRRVKDRSTVTTS
jgi:hypothetical protein